jgi:regulator of sigma E protease
MIHFLISIAGILLTIFFVIGTHESAHFVAARLLGVKVLRFSIGFGKTLLRWHDKKGTEYVFALVPLGGYVKMLDESEGEVPKDELHLAYNNQPYYKKFLIVIAGPLTNIFCALVLYWLIFVIGFVTVRPVTGTITPHSIAAEGGLKPNQEIISVDGQSTLTWTGILFRILAHTGNQDQIRIDVQDPVSKMTESHLLDLKNWHLDGLAPDPLASLGIAPFEPAIPMVIGKIIPDSPAAKSGLKLNDKIIAIDNKAIGNWDALITTISSHPDRTLAFSIERNKQVMTVPVTIGYQRDILFQKTGYLGIAPDFAWPKELLKKVQYGPVKAIAHAWREIYDFTYFNLMLFGKLVTGKLSMQSLGGPITIFESAGDALNYGFLSFIGFLAFLSISIGIINLLPIPGLDGGHLFLQTIEFIIRRPIPEKIISILYRLGFMLIIFVVIIALVNDMLRLV